MSPGPTAQISLLVEAAEDGPVGPEAVEQFAQELRTELTDLGVRRIDQVEPGPGPEGTRAVGFLAICGFIITVAQTGDALHKIIQTVRAVAAKYAQRRQRVRLTIGGVPVDLATAADADLAKVVQALLARPGLTTTGVRSALVIANDRYHDARLAQLRSPAHDAEALARVLGDPAIGGFAVELLHDADERTIRRRVAAFFADRDRDDLLLLHFSGHGVKDQRGRLHLAAKDTDLSVLGATAIPASFVNDLLADTQSRRVVLILDCRYSGAFARGAGVRSGSEVHIADEFGAGSGRVVLTASSATEYAFEGTELTQSEGRPSAFTSALVSGLSSGAADLDADGEIGIDELYDYTYRTVRESTPGQAPMKWSFGVEGSVVIARSVRPAALPAGILDDLTSDRVVLRLEGVRALADLYASGKAGLRAAAEQRLAAVSRDDDSVRVRQAAVAVLGTDRPAPVSTVDPPEPEPEPEPAPRPAPRPVVAPPPRPEPPPSTVDGRLPVGVALLAGGFCLAGIVLYLVATAIGPLTLAGSWYTNLIFLPELVVAGAALWTRQYRWLGLLAGLVTWDWALLSAVPNAGVRQSDSTWPILTVAALCAVLTQLTGLVAVLVGGRAGIRWRWSAGAAVVPTALAVFVSYIGVKGVNVGFDLLPDDQLTGLRTAATVGIALAVAVAVLVGRDAPTAGLTLLGWLVGAVSGAANVIMGAHAPASTVPILIGLAALTALLGYGAVTLVNQRAQPRTG